MDHQGEDVDVVGCAEEARAHGYVDREVEGVASAGRDGADEFVFPAHRLHGQRHPRPLRREHVLVGPAAVALGEHGAQGLVPGDHVVERRLQRWDVEFTVQTQDERHVVRR